MWIGVGVVVLALISAGVIRLWQFLNPDPTASQREPVVALGYCNASDTRPCIVSFGSDGSQTMLVNVLLPGADYPAVYLTITRGSDSFFYQCTLAKELRDTLVCAGWPMPPGEILPFSLRTVEGDKVIAEGGFAIIGLMLPSPAAEATSTLVTETPMAAPTEILFETPTPGVLELPGFPPAATSTPGTSNLPGSSPTPTGSYPNPSYPGPSYNNP